MGVIRTEGILLHLACRTEYRKRAQTTQRAEGVIRTEGILLHLPCRAYGSRPVWQRRPRAGGGEGCDAGPGLVARNWDGFFVALFWCS
jgi:hypothetical protein